MSVTLHPSTSVLRWGRLGSRFTGRKHVLKGMLCQDALAAWPDSSVVTREAVVAVSDGHGDPLYCRSHVGSFLAVKSATDVLGYYAKRYGDRPVNQRLLNFYQDKIPSMIYEKWLRRVKRYLEATPLEPSDLRRLSSSKQELLKKTPTKACGATLLSASVSQEHLALVRIGDGLIIVCDDEGNLSLPFGEADEIGDATESLGGEQPVDDFEVRLLSHEGAPPAMILVSTDGYHKDCGSIEKFLPVVSQFFEYAKTHTALELSETIEASLAHRSKKAPDDLTFGVLLRSDITQG